VLAHAAQAQESKATSGTLNLILADRNGFVIAADSRMSGETEFECHGHRQSYCDDSQKLFQTTQNSALVIAGFAVDGKVSALDLAVAPVLLKEFGHHGLAKDDQAPFIPDMIKEKLSEALTNVAALHYPFDPQHHKPQPLIVTFARIDRNSGPILRRLLYTETLKLSAPLQVYVPQFEVQDSGEVPITKFLPDAEGLPWVAQAIFAGVWKSQDPDILKYYEKKKRDQLDSMSLIEMRRLAEAILHETERYLVAVGGEDQIGVFPTDESAVEFHLPADLPIDALSVPSVLTWVGLDCSGTATLCNGPLTFSVDPQRAQGPYNKFFLAGRFSDVPIALENNIFIGNDFNQVTFEWIGGRPFMLHNHVSHCTLELPGTMPVPRIPDLQECQIVRKKVVQYPPGTVGQRGVFNLGSQMIVQPHP
jgi:hypothetical protein